MIFLFFLFSASFLLLIFFYIVIFSRLAFLSPDQRISESSNLPVSVIICARNQLHNLQKFLPSIFRQDYPHFEVIVVNDRSTDGSQEWLEEFSKQNPNLRVIVNTDGSLPGKRNALKKGLEAARHEVLLLTDADCQPASREWLKLMFSALSAQTEIVLGYSPCAEQNGILNRFIRYENFQTALNYLSFALAGMPYMGVGRNLLYRTPVRTNIGALEHHRGLLSGDDDLTVNRIATSRNTTVMIHPKAHVITLPPISFSEFIHQKRRHYEAGFHYQAKHKFVLGALYSSQVIFNLTLIPLLISGFMLLPVASIFITKNILQTFLFGKAMRRLNVHNLWIFTPVFDLCISLFFLTLGGLSFLKIKTW
ncbi:MAG TPA: glycosyltransferase [Chitinophagales bacterium]|nr:glycosyltransferase [Chitinophagales bacterium]